MASLQSNCTFSFKHHLTIADHFPSKTFSFKHHLTGEAWPACRAILPFHSNTTWQGRHGQLGYSCLARLTGDQTPPDRRGMASLALLASLGSLHIDAFGHVGIVWRGIWPTLALAGKYELLQASCHKMYLHINMWAHMHVLKWSWTVCVQTFQWL